MLKRDYYPLKKAAEILNCTEDDLIHLGAVDKLPIYMLTIRHTVDMHLYNYLEDVLVGDVVHVMDDKPLRLAPWCFQRLEEGLEKVEVDFYEVLVYDDAGRETGIEKRFDVRLGYFDEDVDFDSFDDNDGFDNREIPLIQNCTLIIMAEDLKRLQQPAPNLAESDRDKLLKQIGVLALLLAEKSNKFKVGDRPNASAIATDVQTIVDAGMFPGKKSTGTSEMRDSISQGLKLLKDTD